MPSNREDNICPHLADESQQPSISSVKMHEHRPQTSLLDCLPHLCCATEFRRCLSSSSGRNHVRTEPVTVGIPLTSCLVCSCLAPKNESCRSQLHQLSSPTRMGVCLYILLPLYPCQLVWEPPKQESYLEPGQEERLRPSYRFGTKYLYDIAIPTKFLGALENCDDD